MYGRKVKGNLVSNCDVNKPNVEEDFFTTLLKMLFK